MLSNEWRDYHLTENGWVQGSYKLDAQRKTLAIPVSTKLTRRYCETMDHKFQSQSWYKDTFGNAEMQKELLLKYPHPTLDFKKYKPG